MALVVLLCLLSQDPELLFELLDACRLLLEVYMQLFLFIFLFFDDFLRSFIFLIQRINLGLQVSVDLVVNFGLGPEVLEYGLEFRFLIFHLLDLLLQLYY